MSADTVKRKRSLIWNHFSLTKDSKKAKCLYCFQQISVACGSVGNLTRHIKSKHPTLSIDRSESVVTCEPVVSLESYEDDPSSLPDTHTHFLNLSSTSVALPPVYPTQSQPSPLSDRPKQPQQQQKIISYYTSKKPVSVRRSKELDEQLLKFVVMGFHPFSIVEEEEFKRLVNMLCPGYRLPTRKTLSSSLLLQEYNMTLQIVKINLQEAEAVCLTTDTWTSINNESFIAITAHYLNSVVQLRSALLSCFQIDKRHAAENLSTYLQN